MMEQLTEQNSMSREQYLRELTKSFFGIEKPLKNAKCPATLDELIAELHEVFRSDRVDIEYVNHLLISYQSNPLEWKKFAKFDRYKYTRNLVDEGNGKFNLMILCWGEGHSSQIHDHSNSHCFMKMLKGELREIRYTWPKNHPKALQSINGSTDCNTIYAQGKYDEDDNNNYEENVLDEVSRSIMETNSVHYINDTIGLHRVENTSNSDGAVSLHLYCPPYDSCSIFNQKTGKQARATVEFYSKYGHRNSVHRRLKDNKAPTNQSN